MNKSKHTKAEIIAQHWMYSCDAPDSEETAQEIQRLAQMIKDVMAGREPKWKVVNHSLQYFGCKHLETERQSNGFVICLNCGESV